MALQPHELPALLELKGFRREDFVVELADEIVGKAARRVEHPGIAPVEVGRGHVGSARETRPKHEGLFPDGLIGHGAVAVAVGLGFLFGVFTRR